MTDMRGASPFGDDRAGDDFDAIFAGSGAGRDGRTPPQDHAAEQSVLGAMLLSKDAIADVVEVIRGADFYRPAHELLYDAIIDVYGRGEPADAVTLAAELGRRGDLAKVGGAPYLHTLVAGVPTAANAAYYADIVREKAILRRLVTAGTKIAQLGYTGEGQVDDVVDRAQAEVFGVTDKRTSEDYAPLNELMAATLDEIEAISAHEGGLAGVPTGFADLDDLTNGLHPGQMVIVAARPAVGKSTLALDVCRAASIKHGLTSVIFSLEMSRTEITMRLLSAEAKIALSHMRNGHMTDDDWARLARKMGEMSEAPLFIDDSPNMTMMEIRAKARRLRQRHDLRLVVVDYLQLMSSGRKVESRQVEVSEFSRQMKLLAKELEVPIVAISQLNRGAEQRTDKRPLLSDLRESGCLTADTRLLRADNGAEITLGELMVRGSRDIPVWSLDDRLKLVPRTLTHAFPSGVKEVFRVRLSSGREVTATSSHPFLTYDGWKPLSDLTVGSRVGVIRNVPAPLQETAWHEDEVVLLAHLLGDGSFVHSQPIRYASVDEANLATVAQAAARRFGITAVRHDDAPARVSTLRFPAPYRVARGKRNPVAVWLDGLGLYGRHSHDKFVPAGVFGLPREQVALFLRHLWATDGSVRWDAKNGQAWIYYASTSRQLVADVASLLLRVNVFGRIKRVKKAGYRDCWNLYIYGADNQRRFCDQVGVHGARATKVAEVTEMLRGIETNTNLDTIPVDVWDRVRATLREKEISHRAFAAAMSTQFCGSALWRRSPSRSRMAKMATILADADLQAFATNDLFWDSISSVTSLGETDVYDATVLGTHNFVANGIALHNSLEQDADVVILLHREDMYEPESTRTGEADLIVAKHRSGPTDRIVVAFQGHYSRFVDMQHA